MCAKYLILKILIKSFYMNDNDFISLKYLDVSNKIRFFKSLASNFSNFVFVGFKNYFHSAGFYYETFGEFLDKFSIKWKWIESDYNSSKFLDDDSLVFIQDVSIPQGLFSLELNNKAYYVLNRGDILNNTSKEIKYLKLFEYRLPFFNSLSNNKYIKLDEFVYIFKDLKILIQPWGTPILATEFFKPVCNRETNISYFIGSVWGDKESKKCGNVRIISTIEHEFEKFNQKLIIKNKLKNSEIINLIRNSFISISPGSLYHDTTEYLQCRTFKNISYGRFTYSNVPAFKKILKDSYVNIRNYEDAIKHLCSLTVNDEIELARLQQNSIRNYTFLDMWINILYFVLNLNS